MDATEHKVVSRSDFQVVVIPMISHGRMQSASFVVDRQSPASNMINN
jgi:hypothetical protein